MEKRWRRNKLWLPVFYVISWLTLEAGVCGPHRLVSNHSEFSTIIPSLLIGHLLSPLTLLFCMLLLFHLSQERSVICLKQSLCLALKTKSCSKWSLRCRSTLTPVLMSSAMPALMALSVLTIILSPWQKSFLIGNNAQIPPQNQAGSKVLLSKE